MTGKVVLITGVGGPAGKSAASYFQGKGFHVIGTDIRDARACADEFVIVPPALDPSFAGALMNVVRERSPDLFVPTVTEELVTVSRLKGEIEAAGCALFISAPEAVAIADSKLETALFLRDRGVPAPATFDGSAPREEVIRALGLPLLAKPLFGRGGRGVMVHRTAEAARADSRPGIVLQEFIPGDEYDVNIFMSRSGQARAAVALRKTELKEGEVGNAVSVERAEAAASVDICLRAAALLGLEGPLDFDVRLRADGSPAILEINARLGGNSLDAAEVLDMLSEEFSGPRRAAR